MKRVDIIRKDDDDDGDDAEASMFVFALDEYLYSCLRICANAFRPS